ncbi:MAG: ABC transporter permease [Truepera sp.]|jgi:peptide/nickel transport system permease protein|nr:ABC transporter permease [Truepera sp.]HRQ10185.1 ABC transporter permease [Trueperaceae bacterium]
MIAAAKEKRLVRNKALRRFLRNPGTVLGSALALLLLLVAVFAPQISGDPLAQDLAVRLQPPSAEHLLGTDQLGRDVWSRVVHGSRISLRIGLTVVSVALLLGGFIGLVAGMFGGLVDEVAMRITDIFFAFPALILAMAIAGALGPSLGNLMIAVAAVTWPYYARLIRAQVLSLKTLDFVDASRALGASRWRQALRHVLPNAITPLLVQASFDVGAAILTAAGLGFIGFGAQPPTPEWGAVVSETRSFISEAPWASSAPAIAILITVLAFNLLGDGLRDILDPRGRRRS